MANSSEKIASDEAAAEAGRNEDHGEVLPRLTSSEDAERFVGSQITIYQPLNRRI